MQVWQVQKAKAKLTEFINEAKNTPQIISRRGKPEIIAMSINKYSQLVGKKRNIVSFFQQSPLHNVDLVVDRDKTQMREIDL